MSITANGAAPVTITVDTTSSVVFIDTRVPDVDRLLAGAHAGQRVLLLDPHADGVRQIADALAAEGLRDLSAIHIVSHGTPGQIHIGATLLNARTLADHAALLADIGASLAPGGGILLYGCDVASGAAGRHFIEELSVYTRADVAAASHPVGASARGGSWELDVATGPIAAGLAFSKEARAGYQAVLVAPVLTDALVVLDPVNEDAGVPSGAVGTLISSLVDFPGGGGHDNVTDADPGAVTGIALTSVSLISGSWHYSTDNGVNWTAVPALSSTAVLLLAADAGTRLYFQADPNFNGTVINAIQFQAWDQSAGVNGTTVDPATVAGSLSTANDFANITVTAVDDAYTWGGAGSTTTTTDYNLATNWGPQSGAPPDVVGDNATFANTGNATISVTAPVSPDAWTFAANAQAYAVSGAAVTFGGSGVANLANAGQSISIANVLAGAGGVTQNGASTLTLSGTNTYTGATNITAGTLTLGASNVLPNGTAVTINGATAVLAIGANSDTVASVSLQNGSITGTTGELMSTAQFDMRNGSVTAILAGANGLSKTTTGTVTLSGANTYGGTTSIDAGVLHIQNSAALGAATPGTTVASGAALWLEGGIAVGAEALSIAGTGISTGGALRNVSGSNTFGGTVTLTAAARIESAANLLTLNAANSVTATDQNLTIGGAGNGLITGTITTGAGTLTKEGAGIWILGGANTFTGATSLNAGTLRLAANAALGTTAAGTTAAEGTTIDYADAITITEAITLAGTTIGVTFNQDGNGSALAIQSGVIGGDGPLNKTGTGALRLNGTNTYDGVTNLNVGALILGSDAALGAAGPGNGTNAAGGTTLTYSNGVTIAEDITLGGSVILSTSVGVSATQSGVIDGTGALTKSGAGTIVLTANNTYTGATTISGGTLIVNGSIATSSATTVNSGGTLKGTGNVGDLTVNSGATFAPGNSAGITTTTDFTLNTDATLEIEIEGAGGPGPGGYDQVVASGDVVLGGNLTVLLLGGFHPATGTEHIIISNTGPNPVSNTFANVGATFTQGGSTYSITYTGGIGGNDVVLTALNDAPVVANVTGDTATFTENGTAVLLDQGGNATVADVDSANFETGNVTASITAGRVDAEDVLAVQNQGTGVGQIGVSGTDVTYNPGAGAVTIGSFTGGTGADNLVITLNTNATPAAVQALLRALTYSNSNTADPTTAARTVSITASDGDGGTSNTSTVTVNVTAVNDEPTLSATGGTPTFTEGGAAADLFSTVSVSTVEAGQTITSLTLTVSNVTDGANEIVFFDGSDVALTNGNVVVGTATNGLTVNVTVAANVATVTFSGASLSTAAVQTLVDAMTYRNTSQDPTDANRVVTITQIVDSGADGGGNDNNSNPGVVATVNVNPVNDPPSLTAVADNPTFTENGAAVDLFDTVVASAGESGQNLDQLILTVSNVVGTGATENLTIDGTIVELTHLNSETTATNGMTASVSLSGGTATVTISKVGGITPALMQTLVDTLAYDNTSEDPGAASRVVKLTSIRDVGANGAPDDNITGLNISSTVSVAPQNDAPVNTIPAGPVVVNEDTAVNITGIQVADDDAAPQHIQVTLHVDNGFLDVRTDIAGGVDAAHVTGDTTGTVVLTGTTAQINTTLGTADGLKYQGNLNFVGSDQLDIITNDLGHEGAPGPLSDTDLNAVNITVNNSDPNTISAFQSNAFATGGDTDADGVVDPGENIITTVVITNNSPAGGTVATGLTFAEAVTGMTVTATNVQGIAIADTYNGVTGNTTFVLGDAGATTAQGLLLNDVEFFGRTFGTADATQTRAVVATNQATTQGGTVTINANGSFSYTGAAEFTGVDTFTYSIRDAGLDGVFNNSDDLFDVGTATVNVTGLAWFIDNTGASSNIGTQANPFTSIGAFNAKNGGVGANTPNAGDTIYLREGTYNEADGINLLNNQKLVGQGESLVINSITIETGGSGQTPIIQVTGVGGQGLQLASGNIISGLNVQTNNTGAIGIEDGGGTVGALNISNVTVSGTGKAVDIDQGGALTVSLTSLGSTASTTEGVDLQGVSGTFTAGAGNIAGSTGTGFNVTGGSAAITFSGTMAHTSAGRLISVSDTTGGSVTFNNAGANALTDSGSGILIDGAAGNVTINNASLTGTKGIEILGDTANNATGTFTFNNVAIDTANGAANHAFIVNGDVSGVAGNDVTGTIDLNNVDITNPGGNVVNIQGLGGGSIDFDSASTISNTTGLGIVATSNSGGTITFGGSSKTISTGANAAVNLTSNTGATINFTNGGLDIDTSSGAGFTATGGGTISVAGSGNSINSTGGQALDLNGVVVGGANIAFASTDSGGGARGVNIDTVTGGSIALGTGTLSGHTAAEIDINGGNTVVTYGGTIGNGSGLSVEITNHGTGNITLSGNINDTNDAGGGISVSGNTSGTIEFSGTTKTLNTTTGIGVSLATNTGTTINFSGGGLDIDTTTGAGFSATGGGTVTVTGSNNSINSVSATALTVTNTSIGAADLTFQRIDAGNNTADAEPTNGIVLSNTGTGAGDGGLIVTGTGAANSGGVIQNMTGADNSGTTPGGTGIALNNTRDVQLNDMHLHDFSNYAIRGNGVVNFTMDDSTINGTNGGSAAASAGSPFFDSSISFDNLSGTAVISDTSVSGGFASNVRIVNSSGSLNVTFDNVSIGANSLAEGNDGIGIEATGAANLTITVQNSDFTSSRGDLFQVSGNGTGTTNLTFTGNALSNNHAGIATGGGGVTLGNGGDRNSTFTLTNNTFRDSKGHAVLVVNGTDGGADTAAIATQDGDLTLVFSNNTIGVAGTANSGSLEGAGIKVQHAGGSSTSILDADIINNNIHQYNNEGILIQAGAGIATGGRIVAEVADNVLSNPGTNASIGSIFQGFALNSGVTAGDAFVVYLTLGGDGSQENIFTGSGRNGGVDMRIRARQSTDVHITANDSGGGVPAAPNATYHYTGGLTDAAAVATFLAQHNSGTQSHAAFDSGEFRGDSPPAPASLMAAPGGVEAASDSIPQWQLAGIGDFNGDGSIDLLSLRSDGLLRVDTANAAGELTNWYIVGELQAGWQLVGTGDFNGDGTTDILLGHDSGIYQAELIQNNAVTATVDLELVDGELHVVPPTGSDTPPSDTPPSDPPPSEGDGGTAEAPAGNPAAHPVIVDDGVLSQSELDYFVDAAIARWEAAGLTAEQVTALHDMEFSVADMPGWYLGSYSPDAVRLDSDAAGYGWFLDATPLEDSEFGNVDGTRLTTDPTGAPAGRVDLLTTVMHEMGHELGLEDSYSLGDRSDLMYGYLVTGERRLPGAGDAEDAVLGSVTDEEFQIASINLGSLAGQDTITIQWAATITPSSAPSNNFNEQIEHPTNTGGGTSSFGNYSTNTSVVTLDSLTLGSLIFNDVNGNGIFESASEAGIDGVDLTLFADTNNSGGLDAGDVQIATAETGSGGLYSFTGLAPGNYIVRVDQSNFGVGGALEFIVNSSPGNPDPDDNIDNDDNGAPIAGNNGVASAAITLAYNSEPDGNPGGAGDVDGDADDDTNLTLDMGFFNVVPNAAPIVTTTGTAAQTFTEGGLAADLEPTLTVDDDDDTDLDPLNDNIESALVTITDFFAGDELLFTLSGGLTGGYANGILTISGSASEAVYQTVLRSVQYRSTSDNPDEFGTNISRDIEFVVNDGSQDSLAATTNVLVNVINDAPVLITAASPVLNAVNEDQAGDDPTPIGAVGTLVSALVNLDLPAGGGLDNVTDPDNEFIGIALTGTNTANGTWFYSINNGTNWNAVGAVSDASALLLEADANTRLYFRPTTADFNGAIANAITFRAWDLSNDPTFILNGTLANASVNGNATPYSAASDTASITVTAITDAVTDTPTVAEDSGANTVNVLLNDNFEDAARTLTSFTQGTNGTVARDENGTPGVLTDDRLIYTPNADFHGNDSFTYTVTSGGVTETGTVNVTVTPVADIVNDALTTNEETAVTANVITSGAGADNFEASPVIQSVTQGTNGSVTFAANGSVTYTPNADFTGSDSFTYTVLSGGATETATVNVTVNAVADIVADSVSVAEDSGSNTLDLLANDTFENAGRAITAVGGTQAHGVAAINNNGTLGDLTDDFVTYTPNDLDFNGTDSFTYTVTSNGTTETATVNVTITAVADIVGDSATVAEDSAGATINVLLNDQFEDTTRALSSFTHGTNGVVTRDTNGTALDFTDDRLVYTPNANFDGTDSFTYTVTPPNGTAETATVNITMTAANDAPVLNAGASPLLTNGTEDSGAPVGVVGTLVASLVDLVGSGGVDNVSEFDTGALVGIALTGTNTTDGTWFYSTNNGTNWTAVGAVSDASALLLAADVTTRLYFQPNANFNGTISNAITFRAWDQTSGTNGQSGVNVSVNGGTTAFSTDSDTASLTVNEVNDAPVAVDDPLSAINEDSGVRTITFADLTGNDLDGPANESAQTLTVSAVGNAVGGTVAIVSGHVEFTPTLNFNGTASFDYTVLDNGTTNGSADAKTDVGSVSFTVNPVNDAPVLSDVAPLAIRPPTGGPVTLDSALTISDVDNTTLTSATVRISAGSFLGDGDVLSISAAGLTGTSITASFNAATETLTLSGIDTLAHYEQALEHVVFESTGPNPTNSGLNKTRTIEWQLNDGSGANNLSAVQTTTINLSKPQGNDFNGDGKGDLFWTTNSGPLAVWEMNGFQIDFADYTRLGASAVGRPGADWHVVDVGDVNGDGKTDILWRTDSGRLAVWEMDGNHIIGADYLRIGASEVGTPGPDWHALGLLDTDGNGTQDVLWRTDSGALAVWQLDGNQITFADYVRIGATQVGVPGPDWNLVGDGDFDGDGKGGLLWRTDSGAMATWELDGNQIKSAAFLKQGATTVGAPGADWHVVDTADFNGDGKADILWRTGLPTPTSGPEGVLEPGGGQTAIWQMDGNQIAAADYTRLGSTIVGAPGPDWHIVGAEDYDGDGQADLLWRTDSGALAIWRMDGTQIEAADYTRIGSSAVGAPGPDWHIYEHRWDLV